jgi:hypothetical protein
MPKKHHRAAIFCGSRHWKDEKAIKRGFDEFQPHFVICGGQRGADALSIEEAKARKCRLGVYEADFQKYGRAAGPIRNAKMLDRLLALEKKGWEISVVAFPHPSGKGTQNMIYQALLKDVPCFSYKMVVKFEKHGKHPRRMRSTRFD